MFEHFTDRARSVMALANQEAQRYRYEFIGTEHVLMALVKDTGGAAVHVLRNLGVDPQHVMHRVENLVRPGPDMAIMGKLSPSPGARRVVELAEEEARTFGHDRVGTEHLLLGLMRVPDTTAVRALLELGLDLDRVRQEVSRLMVAIVATETPAPAKPGADAGLEEVNAAWSRLTPALKSAILAIVRATE